MEHTAQFQRIPLGGVNCYLAHTAAGFVLIDCGMQAQRKRLVRALRRAGCLPGSLRLVILTHGDQDHSGNAAFLRQDYGAQIAIHRGDAVMLAGAWGRKPNPDYLSPLFRLMLSFTRRAARKRPLLTPDLLIDEDFDLGAYGLAARVVHLPGHSPGSIGILTAQGDLYCGDLFFNLLGKPIAHLVDDLADYRASLEKLRALGVKMLHPGHGAPFAIAKARRTS
ncbi:MAG: MBL fold metallo-hydrolase [Anaerolineae bacterium]|nr:MBL fold metallo-hydrolase [Anaerolineae bacterium]